MTRVNDAANSGEVGRPAAYDAALDVDSRPYTVPVPFGPSR